jgi:hypothetical protein
MDERIKAIVLKENPTAYGYDTQLWTCNIVAEVIEKIFLVKVLPSTVYVHLKKLGLSAQRPEYVARERDPVEIARFLNNKFPRIQKLANKIDARITRIGNIKLLSDDPRAGSRGSHSRVA